jgi:hypothetical protein
MQFFKASPRYRTNSKVLCLSQKKSIHKRESLVRLGWLIKL